MGEHVATWAITLQCHWLDRTEAFSIRREKIHGKQCTTFI
jgi:hypothetical protein